MDFKTLLKINCFSSDYDARILAAEILQMHYNCEINVVEMDESVQFAHNGKGCTIAASKLSEGVVIFQNVTIGSNQTYNLNDMQWENIGTPVIGKNVVIADGAKLLGPIIIGDNSVVAAGAIITKDVPKNSLAFGVNKIKTLSPNKRPVFYPTMPTRESQLAASKELILKYEISK